MNATIGNKRNPRGFTLIEVIITIVIAAIMGAMLVTVMGKSLTQSSVPVSLVDDQYKLVQEMEKITSEYRFEINNTSPFNFSTFQAYVSGEHPPGISVATELIPLTSTGGTSYTTQQVLRVTLRDGDQSLQTIFSP